MNNKKAPLMSETP